MLKKIVGVTLGVAFATAVFAAPFMPPNGPLYIKFDNLEQVSPTNSVTFNGVPTGEGNWGVAVVSTIALGGPIPSNQLFNPQPGFVFTDSASGQITAMFHGATTIPPTTCPTCLDATGGFLDLYWDVPNGGGTLANLTTATPSDRTGLDTFTNFTDGTLLVRLAFASGIDPLNPLVDIRGSVVPSSSPTGFTGIADSFANVVTGLGGAWEDRFDTDFFNTAFGTRDVRLRNIYNDFAGWNGAPGVFGATSSDPVRAFAIPEPGSILLLGLGLLGLGLIRRKERADA